MRKSRATSFYVNPKTQLYFSTSTLATRAPDGSWVEFTHRKDLERFAAEHPEWDAVCYVGSAGGLNHLLEQMKRAPEEVERWRIDERVVNGRAPSGPASALFSLATSGLGGVGGTRQLIERTFPGANKPLAEAIERIASLPGAHTGLSVAVALRDHIGDDRCAALLDEARLIARYLTYLPVDPFVIESTYGVLTEHYSDDRAQKLLASLVGIHGLDEATRYMLAQRTTDPELLGHLAQYGSDRTKMSIADKSNCPPEVLIQFAADSDWAVRHTVTENPSCPRELLAQFAADSDRTVRRAVAKNPSLPPEAVVQLAADFDSTVREAVAKNPSCPPEVLAQFATDLDDDVMCAVAKNPSCPPEVLGQFATDSSTFVRRAVAKNPSCPPEVLIQFAADSDWAVRHTVTENPRCPPQVRMEILVVSRDPDDRAEAALLAVTLGESPLLPHPGVSHLGGLLRVASLPDLISAEAWPQKPTDIYTLPGLSALPWAVDDAIEDLRTKTVRDGRGGTWHPRPLNSGHALDLNANYMGNCTGGYADAIASGETAILALDDDKGETLYNVEISRSGGGWRLGEVNSRFNAGDVPDEVVEQLHDLVSELNAE